MKLSEIDTKKFIEHTPVGNEYRLEKMKIIEEINDFASRDARLLGCVCKEYGLAEMWKIMDEAGIELLRFEDTGKWEIKIGGNIVDGDYESQFDYGLEINKYVRAITKNTLTKDQLAAAKNALNKLTMSQTRAKGRSCALYNENSSELEFRINFESELFNGEKWENVLEAINPEIDKTPYMAAREKARSEFQEIEKMEICLIISRHRDFKWRERNEIICKKTRKRDNCL